MATKKEFDMFVNHLNVAYCQYHVFKTLEQHSLLSKTTYDAHPYFWRPVSDALIMSFSVGLAKLVEKQTNPEKEVLSIFYLLEHKLSSADEIIRKLNKLRNKVLMHHDLKTASKIDTFLSEVGLKYWQDPQS